MTASTEDPIVVYRLDPAEVSEVFRAHFGGPPSFWHCTCGCESWLAYRATKGRLWVQGCYAQDATGLTRVIALEDERDLQAYLSGMRRINPGVLDDQIAEIAAVLRPHLPGAKAN